MNLTLETERLWLRPWRGADLAPFTAMNADPRVMEHFPAPFTPEESEAQVERFRLCWQRHGIGRFAVEEKASGRFLGMVGVSPVDYETPFTPAHEIAWRLVAEAWGRGLASEAARRCLEDAFRRVGLAEVVAMTALPNRRSEAVMLRIGMARDPEGDFEHPLVEPGHPLRAHLLYRLRNPAN